MTAEHFALLPPESPVLNGGDWLDLGTKECPIGWITGRHPDTCECGGSGRVPVVPTWTCPTCGGGGEVSYPEWEGRVEDCEICNGAGVVHEGWLALGAAAHDCPQPDDLEDNPAALDGGWCGACDGRGTVPASLSELVRVQTDGRIVERVTLSDPITDTVCGDCGGWGRVHATNGDGEWSWDTESGWVWEDCHCLAAWDARHEIGAPSPKRNPTTVPLPQQVGWYQADDALVAEIERRKP